MVKGIIKEGENREPMIGQIVSDYNRIYNSAYTDTTGYFELKFQGDHPIVVLSGFYQPIYVQINPDEFNEIIIDEKLQKTSYKLHRALDRK